LFGRHIAVAITHSLPVIAVQSIEATVVVTDSPLLSSRQVPIHFVTVSNQISAFIGQLAPIGKSRFGFLPIFRRHRGPAVGASH
jgi:hypothetical protein